MSVEISRRDLLRAGVAIFATLALPVSVGACATEFESTTPVVSVEALLANSEEYKDKKVRLNGVYAQYGHQKDDSKLGFGGSGLQYNQDIDYFYAVHSTNDMQTPAITTIERNRGVTQNSQNFAPQPFMTPEGIARYQYIEGIWSNIVDTDINPEGAWYLDVTDAKK